ncbi:MAG: hypothetical protein B0D92_05260 [Spirochaeta sp. LUC14_002_19_P3]|nr:MAG: hypothetical protein B0D92_05260 [Spirochaeta sp. LUC14_002_19_P3]
MIRWNILLPIFSLLFMLPSCTSIRNRDLTEPDGIKFLVDAVLEGKKLYITEEDYPNIEFLLSDSDPVRRQAGLLLAGLTKDRVFYPKITEAALSGDKTAADTAVMVMNEHSQLYVDYLQEILLSSDSAKRLQAILILSKIDYENLVPLFIDLFKDEDEKVRNQASLAVHSIADRENPYLREALNADPLTASMAYRTLGWYADSRDAPLFIEAFGAADALIRKEAQLSALRLGEAGLPFLHAAAADSMLPFDSRLAALNVIQGIRSANSLVTLFKLLRDPDGKIRTKVTGILGGYGVDALPFLSELYESPDAGTRLLAIKLMGRIRVPEAIPVLVQALADNSAEVVQEVQSVLEAFGTEAWPELRAAIQNLAEPVDMLAMTVLRSGSDIWLIYKGKNAVNSRGLYLLITASGQSELTEYLESIDINRSVKESIISLQASHILAEEFISLEAELESRQDAYFRVWRQKENYAAEARKKLKESFEVLHQYFDTKDTKVLKDAKKIREESRALEEQSRFQESLLKKMPWDVRNRGLNQLVRYRELREELVRSWEYVSPELREAALAIYARYGVNPISLSQKSVLLE